MQPARLTVLFLTGWLLAESASAAADRPYGLISALPQADRTAVSGQLPQSGITLADHVIRVGSSPTFEIEFIDVRDHSGTGFDHPLLGIDRRAIAVAVFERIGQVLDGEPGTARIRFDSRSPWLNPDTLAIGIPYYQCINGFQKPIIFNALRNNTQVHDFEGEMLVNFNLPLSATFGTPPVGQYDLYTLILHEVMHVLGFVGFNVEANGSAPDCGGGARMLPEVARYVTSRSGAPLWTDDGGSLRFTGVPADLPSATEPVNLGLLGYPQGSLRLATGTLRVSGHWLPEDFAGREGVLMLREPFPSGQKRRNITPETKSILSEVLGYRVSQEVRGLTGSWVDASMDSQGFSLHFISANRFAVYFFGFDDHGDPLWLVGLHTGAFRLGETLNIPMFKASGGRFTQPPVTGPTETLWGSLQLRFLDCLRATATLSGVDGSRDMTLLQLAGVDQLDCF